jgi:hypothetical protein
MKTIARDTLLMLFVSSPALAAGGTETEGSGFLVILFWGFGALIIVSQLLPGLMLFGSMIKELFCKPMKAVALAGGKTSKTE